MVNIAILEAYSEVIKKEKNVEYISQYVSSPGDSTIGVKKYLSLIESKALGDDTTLVNIIDGNMETYFKGFSATLDMGKQYKISQIRFAPRNANNGIIVGDRYELMYWAGNWRSAGIRKAKYNYLEFNGIPDNTIYWLKNLDRGKEELAFILKNGEQLFVNHDSISTCFRDC